MHIKIEKDNVCQAPDARHPWWFWRSLSFLSFKETFKDFFNSVFVWYSSWDVESQQWDTLNCTSGVKSWQAFKPMLITVCHPICFKAMLFSCSLYFSFSPSLSLYILTSLLLPACLNSLLSSLVSPLHPSLCRSQHVTSFISSISLSTCLSFFSPSKMLLSNLSGGPQTYKFTKDLFFSSSLSLLWFSNAFQLFITPFSSPSFLCSSLLS